MTSECKTCGYTRGADPHDCTPWLALRVATQEQRIEELEDVLRVRNKVIDKYRKSTEKTMDFLNSI